MRKKKMKIDIAKLTSLQRGHEATISDIDTENSTILLSFSSEQAVERGYYGERYLEVLEHSASSINFERLHSKAPFLNQHDPDQQVGVVEKAWLEDGKGRAMVRFSKSDKGQEYFNDFVDGIRGNISFGYTIDEMIEDGERDGLPVFKATRFTPFEISQVSIPADNSVGLGRMLDTGNIEVDQGKEPEQPEQLRTEDEKMPEEKKQPVVEVNESEIREKILADQKLRVEQIGDLGQRHNVQDIANEAIASGKSVEEFRSELLHKLEKPEPVKMEDPKIGLSEKEVRSYSFLNVVNALASRDFSKAGLELEASQEIAKRLGKDPQGLFVPYDVQASGKRDLTTQDATQAGYLVQNEYGSFIDYLYKSMFTSQAGATVLSGLQGDLLIPKQTGSATGYWVNEGVAPTASNLTTGQVSLVPRTLGTYSDLSRKLLIQSSPSIEGLVRADLAKRMGIALDTAALSGAGATEPMGLDNITGVGSVTWATTATPTWGEIVDLETAVAVDDALLGSLNYVTSASLRGELKQIKKDAGSGDFVIEGNSTNGYPVIPTNICASNKMYFGNWSDLLIGYWGNGLDILTDPYTNSASGTVRIRVLMDADIAVRHAESFAIGSD